MEVSVDSQNWWKQKLFTVIDEESILGKLCTTVVGTHTKLKMSVPVDMWNTLRNFQQQGAYSQLTHAQLERQVATHLEKHPGWSLLMARHPRELEMYQTQLVTILTVYKARERVSQMEFLTGYNELFSSYNEMRSAIGKKHDGMAQDIKVYHAMLAFFVGLGIKQVCKRFWGFILECADRFKWEVLRLLLVVFQKMKNIHRSMVGAMFATMPGQQEFRMGVMWPFIEEVIKDIGGGVCEATVPGTKFFFHYAFAISELIFSVWMQPNYWLKLVRILPVFLHTGICHKSFVDRLLDHSMWNSSIAGPLCYYLMRNETRETKFKTLVASWILAIVGYFFRTYMERWALRDECGPYKEFCENFYFKDWKDRKPWVITAGCTPFPQSLSMTPTQAVSYFESKPLNEEFTMISFFKPPGWKPEFSAMYWLIPTNVHGYVPSRSDANLIAMVEARIMAAPPMNARLQEERWLSLPPQFEDFPLFTPIVRNEHVDEWLLHMEASKQSKYKRHIKEYETCTPLMIAKALKASKIQVKCDELLIKGENGGISLKPRAIVNINPLIQVIIGPEIYEATERLKKLWNLHTPFISGGFSFAFGSSGTDKQLTLWLQWTLTRPDLWHIIVAGDDMLLINHYLRMYIEGDASMFDQSQARGPLLLEHQLLRRLGVSEYAIDVSLSASAANYVGYSGDKDGNLVVSIDKHGEANRASGHCDTTIGNSIVMALASRYAIMTGGDDLPAIHHAFAHLGLKMKLKPYRSFFEVTFLKGMWYPTHSDLGFYWGPLPSRILKVGKSLRDPRMIYKTKDFEQAAKWFLGDVARGYSAFLEVPVLRAFVHKHAKNSHGKSLEDLDPRIRYKVNASEDAKPQIASLEYFCERYSTTPEELDELEALYPDAPFNFVQHPLLEKLVVDYM
jgi:hypothetical protein